MSLSWKTERSARAQRREKKMRERRVNKCTVNLKTNNVKLKLNANTQCVIKNEAEFLVKDFRTSPHDSSKLRVEVLQ